jgi:hypothetical protein
MDGASEIGAPFMALSFLSINQSAQNVGTIKTS